MKSDNKGGGWCTYPYNIPDVNILHLPNFSEMNVTKIWVHCHIHSYDAVAKTSLH